MYRWSGSSNTPERDYPTSPKLNRRTLPASGSRRLFSSRARLHPVVLVPVFLCGFVLAPWISEHLLGDSRLPEPVFNPREYQWTPKQAFAPADAPPLVADDEGGLGDPSRGSAAAARRAVEEAARASGRDDEEWEWWGPSAADPNDSPSPSLTDLTSSLYTVHAGLLYYRSSPALIPRAALSKPFPIAPAVRAGAPRAPPFPHQPDQGLSLPPQPPKDWLLPGELFTHSPGHRRHAIAPASGAESKGQPVPLRAPLPAQRRAPAAPPPGADARERAAILRERNDPGRARGKSERDAQGRVLGANAAAAARAAKAGRPFIPGKPQELLEEEKKLQKLREHERALEENQRGVRWHPAPADGVNKDPGPQHVVLDGHAIIDDEDDIDGDDNWDEADAMWRGAGGAPHADRDAEDSLAGELAAGDEDDDEDDTALLEAVRALSPEELALLSDDERALVAELEAKQAAKEAAPPAPMAPPVLAPKPARRGVRGGDTNRRPPAGDPDALRRAQALREARRLNPPRAPLPKPVFKGEAGQLADKRRREGGGLAKRGLMVDEPNVEPQPAVAPPVRKLRKRAVLPTVDGVEEHTPEPSSSATELAASSLTSSSLPSRPTPSSTVSLTRRALPDNSEGVPSNAKRDRLHPISHLIARAEEEWDDMLRRQSQTLEQAVEEYRRRYNMNPPVGFDSWWRYAMQNRVVLVDEFDQIHSDILPFLSLRPSEFRRRVMSLSTDQSLPWYKQSFQLRFREGAVSPGQGAGEAAERRDAVLDLLAEFSEMLPDMEVRMGKGDEPMVVVSGEARERHERSARAGELTDVSSSFEIAEPSGFTPWDSLCPPNSTARRVAQALPIDKPRDNSLKSFITTAHVQAMDLCQHPDLRALNGFTAWSGPRPYLLYPLFSFVKTSIHADLLVPAVSNDFFAEIGRDPVWEQKKQNKVLWRGDTTGAYHSKGSGWRQSHRARLVALANAKDGDSTFHLADATSDAMRLVTAPTRDVIEQYFDVAYTGAPKQCSVKDTTCKQIQHEMRFDKWLSAEEENKYKYVLDVDANYASGKFKRLMSSRSLVLKSTIFPEWWSQRIMPWYHYIPIQSDYSDLVDVAAFFIGAPDGTGSHDAAAKRIAQQGKAWSERHFRDVDMAAYLFRLLLEYARLLHREDDDLQSMDFGR